MIKKYVKKLLLAGLLSLTMLGLTGCAVEDALSGLGTSLNNRVQYNIDLLTSLKNVGLITEPLYEELVKNVQKNATRALNLSSTDVNSDAKFLKPSVSFLNNKEYASFKSFADLEDEDKEAYPRFEKYRSAVNDIETYLGKDKGNTTEEGKIKPFDIFAQKDESTTVNQTSLNSILRAEIYVMNSDKLAGQDLSEIAASFKAIKTLKDKANLTEDEKNTLSKARGNLGLFSSSGMTIMDGIDEPLTRQTANNTLAWEIAHGESLPLSSDSTEANLNNPEKGLDLAIFSDDVPVFAIKLNELNANVVNQLVAKLNASKDYYLIDYVDGDPAKGVRIYKMVYPVTYIDSVKWDNSSQKASVTLKESDLIEINIMSGEVVLKKPSTLLNETERAALENIYNIAGNSENNSSFDIWKVEDTTETLPNGNESQPFKQNTILLKDYLEYTYLPEFIDGETFVALGRRLRIDDINTDNTLPHPEEFAKFIDKTGRPIDGASAISVEDLMDKTSDNSNNDSTAIRLSKSATSSSNTANGERVPVSASYVSGSWKNGQAPNDSKWWFEYKNGEYAFNNWFWIDADGDGTAYCYYFDIDGWCMQATGDSGKLSIGGNTVNASGELLDSNGDIVTKDVSNLEPSNELSSSSASTSGTTGFASDKSKYRFTKTEYKDEIHPVMAFPSKDDTDGVNIATSDAYFNGTDKSRTILYGLCTDIDMFKSQLYSGWINIKGDGGDTGSLNWWNKWLETAKFDYRIDVNALAEYLGLNYTADIVGSDKNLIVLDENTLNQIQKDINKEDRVEKVTWLRTMFVALGYISIVYAMLLLSSWIIDTGIVADTKFMGILTGGRCVAVRDEIEIPTYNRDGTKYLTFQSTLIRSILIIAIASVLINLDFIAILGNIAGTLTGFSKELLNRIFNMG